jgi:membrane protein DedA with SNARE-associated domain
VQLPRGVPPGAVTARLAVKAATVGLTWLTVVCWAAFMSYGAVRFHRMVEDQHDNGIVFGALVFVFACVAQCGLIIAPWAPSRSAGMRVLVAALMAPPAVFIGYVARDVIEALLRGHRLSIAVSVLSILGVAVYGIAYTRLVWRSRPRRLSKLSNDAERGRAGPAGK